MNCSGEIYIYLFANGARMLIAIDGRLSILLQVRQGECRMRPLGAPVTDLAQVPCGLGFRPAAARLPSSVRYAPSHKMSPSSAMWPVSGGPLQPTFAFQSLWKESGGRRTGPCLLRGACPGHAALPHQTCLRDSLPSADIPSIGRLSMGLIASRQGARVPTRNPAPGPVIGYGYSDDGIWEERRDR